MTVTRWRELAREGPVRRFGPPEGPAAAVADLRTHLLDPAWRAPAGATTVIAYAGTLGPGLFGAHPHTWLPPGRAALEHRLETIEPALAAEGRALLLLPHVRHVLSDGPGTRAFLESRDGAGIVLAPARLLEPSMLPDAEDHLVRIVARLGPVCRLAWIEDAARADDGGCRIVPPGEGELPAGLLADLIAEHVPAGVPVIDH